MFEHALEDCLTRMRLEGATPEECFAQYPQFRLELAPLLIAAQDLGSLDSLEPRVEFRAQARAKLIAHMRANPRRRESWYGSLAFKYAASLASAICHSCRYGYGSGSKCLAWRHALRMEAGE